MNGLELKWVGVGIAAMLAGVVGCGGTAHGPETLESVDSEQAEAACPSDCGAFRYRVTDLGSLSSDPGDVFITVGRFSERGRQIVGGSDFQAYLWQNGTMTGLGTLGGSESGAYSINDAGLVVGVAATADESVHAFSWKDGTMTDLGTLGGRFSTAVDVNDRGQIAGYAAVPGPDLFFHAFLYDGGAMQDLGTLGGTESFATAINRRGHIVGYSEGSVAGANLAAYWHDGALDAFAGRDQVSHAYDINDKDQIVGDIGNGLPRAFLYTDGELVDIGPAGAATMAFAINNLGSIVGVTSTDEPPRRPDLSGPEGFIASGDSFELLRDEMDSCWDVVSPADINDRGQIVAVAYACDGVLKRHGLLLDPVAGCRPHGGHRPSPRVRK
jgi:probable HAF family extracellular repeat protein